MEEFYTLYNLFYLLKYVIAQAILFQYPAWHIYKKAGLNPLLSLTVLIPPYIGILICVSILAWSNWKALPNGGR